MTAIIISWAGIYKACIYEGDTEIDGIFCFTVGELKKRVKAVYGIDCE